jgi:glycosyltransferase involved in cell wall biosynthesis
MIAQNNANQLFIIMRSKFSRGPLVSVVVPAYNAEKSIQDTLQSVTAQSYRNIEVLVVDDGSNDRTAEIVHCLSKSDRRIALLQQRNHGVGAARNLALRKATGKFIAPVDADDIWASQKLEKQVRCLLNCGPEVGLVYAWSAKLASGGQIVQLPKAVRFEGNVYLDLLLSNFVGNASAPLIRSDCFETVGGYCCHFQQIGAQGCEDWDLYLRIAEKFEFRVVPEFLVGYRSHQESMSANYRAMERSYVEMIRAVTSRHPALPDRVLRWSASDFYFYLTGKSSGSGDFVQGLLWLGKSVRLDPLRFLSPKWHKALLVCLISFISRSTAQAIVAGEKPWQKSRSRRQFDFWRKQTIEAAQHLCDLRPSIYERFITRRRNVVKTELASQMPFTVRPDEA